MREKKIRYRTYKRKLILTKKQEQRIHSWIGVCRLVYNMGLEIKIDSYKKKGKSPSKFDLMKQLTALRKEYKWISDVPCHVLQNSIARLQHGYEKFFNGSNIPKFSSKKTYRSITFPDEVYINNKFITLPKLGNLKFHKDAPILGTPKTATIKIEPTGFFVYVVCDNAPQKFNSENQAIGIDMGINRFCTKDDGSFIPNPRHFKKYEDKLRIECRSLSRKKLWSNSWYKQCIKVSLIRNTIANVRKDFLHKESTKIAKSYSMVYVENLKINNMARNKKLSKHILDCGWGMFRDMLEYKTTVVRVAPHHTSQTCPECGHVDAGNRSGIEFKCLKCSHEDHADVVGAKNVRSRGTALVRQREAVACASNLEPTIKGMPDRG